MSIKKTFKAADIDYTIKIHSNESWLWNYTLESFECNVRKGQTRVIGNYLFYAKYEYSNIENVGRRQSKHWREISWVMYEAVAEKRKNNPLLSQHQEIINDFESNV